MASWIWGTSQFDEEVDKATSELLPTDQEDIALNLEICDQIKSKQVQPKDAMRALKRRLNHKNPNVQLLALTLTDVCVKNGGNHFLVEICSREFMDNYVSILKIVSLNHDVKNRMLRFVQNWALALEGKPEYSYMNTVYKTLVSEGYKFPPKDLAIANNAMTETSIAPEWIDSDVCLRCRDPFTFTNRKHHCRNCGQVFDQKCSSKSLPLPHFGIMQEVRVCDPCHFKLTRKKEAAAKEAENAAKKVARQQIWHEEIDEDLARAIELSLKESQSRPAGYAPLRETPRTWATSEPPLVERNQGREYNDEDEELRAAIEASLREAHAPQPSAPAEEPSASNERVYDSPVASVPSYELAPLESDAIMTFNQTISDAQTYGLRDLRQTHELYSRATTYQPKLTKSLDDTQRKEELLSEMHDKLSEAVKLYDHLLTEQFAQSSRRQQVPSQPSYAPYMPLQQQYQPQQQWNTQPNIPAQYANQYGQMQPYAPSSPMPDQRWAQTPTPYGVESAPLSAPAQQAPPSQEPTFASQQVTQPPMTIQPSQYQVPSQPSSSYVQTLPSVTLPPVTLSSPYSQPVTSQSPVPVTPTPAQPVQQPQQPLQQQAQQQQVHLSRHNTVQHHHVKQASLHRSNTTANSRQHQQPFYANQQQQQQYQQPQQQQQQQQQPQYNVASPPTTQPTALPVLPTAPTNAPTNYSLFGSATAMPSVPNVPPAAEPKEAMLISFD